MSATGLFVIGLMVTFVVAVAMGLLIYAAILDGRDGRLARQGAGSRLGASMNLFETAHNQDELTTLAAAIDRAGLNSILARRGPYTVLAPQDSAFAALPEGTVDWLLDDPQTLAEIVNYHLVPGRLTAADMAQRVTAATVQGEDIVISNVGAIGVDGAHVVHKDIEASNGVIHVIDRVLIPARI
ncbi:MAG TPA: fasciclin domain-containing protein [Chloroflexota bacterium]|nr:fasciclin domain-containing protein [Chloroflexota bacterium]